MMLAVPRWRRGLNHSLREDMKITDIGRRPCPFRSRRRFDERVPRGRFVRTIVESRRTKHHGPVRWVAAAGAVAAFERSSRICSAAIRPHRGDAVSHRQPASLYNHRTQMLAALEVACLDILGQKWGVPV